MSHFTSSDEVASKNFEELETQRRDEEEMAIWQPEPDEAQYTLKDLEKAKNACYAAIRDVSDSSEALCKSLTKLVGTLSKIK